MMPRTTTTTPRAACLPVAIAAACLALLLTPFPSTVQGRDLRPQKPTATQMDTLDAESARLDSLEAKIGRGRLTRMLSDYVFVPQAQGGPVYVAGLGPGGSELVKSTDPYVQFAGNTIRSIHVNRLDIFTGLSQDTTQRSEPWFYRAGNSIHTDTREGKIRSYLLFNKGDPLDPNELADSERILRDTPFIQDARVAVVPIPGVEDSVDVLVLTRDVWSIGVTASINSKSNYKFKVFDRNLFGFGHSLENEFDIDSKRIQTLDYKLTYSISNMYGTFIDGLVQYRNTHVDETALVSFARGFISPQIRYAGAVSVSASKLKDDLNIVTQTFDRQDMWIGRSFELGRKRGGPHSRRTFVIAGRTTRTDFRKHPVVGPDDRTFTDRTLYLWSLSLAKNNFNKGRLIFGFGTTEDVPYGYLIDFTAGYELAKGARDREYTGVGLRAGGYLGKLGYFIGNVQAGSFFLRQLNVETVIDARAGYFTNLIPLRRFALRQFVAVRYIVGTRKNEQIKLDDEAGIRGLEDVGLLGSERLVAGLQTVLFTPWNWLGFKTAVFAEADVGAIGPQRATIHNQRFYSGFGLGVRIDNERLVFDPFEIRVNVYPGPPGGQPTYRFFFSSVNDFPIQGFAVGAPNVVGFK
jgi:hypothetical protein